VAPVEPRSEQGSELLGRLQLLAEQVREAADRLADEIRLERETREGAADA
jgi:hypothetical protein